MKLKTIFLIVLGSFFACISVFGQVTIGSVVKPEKAALLDFKDKEATVPGGVTSTKGGVLLPRVQLDKLDELSPFFTALEIANPDYESTEKPTHKGLLVYNVGSADIPTGAYIWSGSEWQIFGTKPVIKPSITGLLCNNASISPAVFVEGEAYNGVLKIPYTGGNGGSYASQPPIISTGNTGLVATLQSGTLEYGNGDLIYSLKGTPSSGSVPAEFGIHFLGFQCNASVVGSIMGIGEYITFIGKMPAVVPSGTLLSSYYPTQLPVIDGLRMDLAYADRALYRSRIYNTSSLNQRVSFQSFATVVNENKTQLDLVLKQNEFLSADANDVVYWTTSAAEVETTNLQVQVSPGVWRWYEFKWWCMEIDNEKTIFLSVVRQA